MKKSIITIALFVFLSFPWSSRSFCQVQNDTTKTFRNTIRFNITNPLLLGDKYNVIGYERILARHQSISANIGRFSLPKFISINTDSLKLRKKYIDKGFTFAIDYRFYLRKENRYVAPRGIYIGPYYSFNYFERENSWSMNTANMTGDINSNIRLNLNLVGAQMGYQFVIKNRVALDLILVGPGIWFYNVRTRLSINFDPEDESLLYEKINEILAAKLPGHEILINSGKFKKNSSFSTYSAGFRYIVHIGFRF